MKLFVRLVTLFFLLGASSTNAQQPGVVIQQQLDVSGSYLPNANIAQTFKSTVTGQAVTLTIKANDFFGGVRSSTTAYLYQADSPENATSANLLAVSDTLHERLCSSGCDLVFTFTHAPTLRANTMYLWRVQVVGQDIGQVGTNNENSVGGLAWANFSGTWYNANNRSSSSIVPVNFYFVLTGLAQPSDLAITNVASSQQSTIGSNIAYTIIVTNNGPGTASDIVVSDLLPPSNSFVSCSSQSGVCTGIGNRSIVTIPYLAVDTSEVITIIASVNCLASNSTSISNTATVDSLVNDPIIGNNAATATTNVSGAPSLINCPSLIISGQLDASAFNRPNANAIAQTFKAAKSGKVAVLSIKTTQFVDFTRGALTAYIYQTDSPLNASNANLLAASSTIPAPSECFGYGADGGNRQCDISLEFSDPPILQIGATYLWLVVFEGAASPPYQGASSNGWGTKENNTVGGPAWARFSEWLSSENGSSGDIIPLNYFFILSGEPSIDLQLHGNIEGCPTEITPAGQSITRARFPLGSTFTLQITKKDSSGNSSPVRSSFLLENANVIPSIPHQTEALFRNDVVIALGVASVTDKTMFQAVHLGTVLLNIVPENFDPVRVLIEITLPLRLGNSSTQNTFDNYFIDAAHQRGLPPQLVKGLAYHESNHTFFTKAYRYEPLNSDTGDLNVISKGKNLRMREPYSLYRLEISDAVSRGLQLVPEDITPRSKYKICPDRTLTCDPLQLKSITNKDTFVSALEIYWLNDGARIGKKGERWSANVTPDLATAIERDPSILDFPAQTTLAASYGLMQLMYVTVIDDLRWDGEGVSKDKNPNLLFEPRISISLGAKKIRRDFAFANKGIVRFTNKADLEQAFKNALHSYNANPNYPTHIINESRSFMPVPASSIFPNNP